MKSAFIGILMLAAMPALGVSVNDVPNPRKSGGWISDVANVIDASKEVELNRVIGQLESEMGIEIAVVTVDDVDAATPKDFTTALFNQWGLGKANKNNGLLIVLAKNARRLEMETGYGLESILTDGWLKSMQGKSMVPYFKKGDFGGGFLAGVNACAKRFRDNKEGLVTSIENPGKFEGSDSSAPWFALFGGGGALATGGALALRRRKKTRCPECAGKLLMLSESEDDEKLSEAQRLEEQLGSVDYQYWYCENDGYTRLDRIDKWFSGYSSCRLCGSKTMKVTTTTVRAATEYSTGKSRITADCRHCDYHNESTRTIPRITRSTTSGGGFSSSGGSSWSSGSSSGGSFGGGSSGGGGAGSSW